MIATDVIKERFGRNGKKNILQLFQVPNPGYLDTRLRITEHKVAKTEIIGNNPAKIDIHFLGILINERSSIFSRIGSVLCLGRLDDQGYERIFLPDFRTKLDSCHAVLLSFLHTGKADIGDDSQYIIGILIVYIHCLLISTGQYYFGTPAHTECTLMGIQSLGRELLTLLQHKFIKIGKHG